MVRLYGIALALQELAQHCGEVAVVIDDQDACVHG
jgi:hypothetical protein